MASIENLRFLRVNGPGLQLFLQILIVRQGGRIDTRIDRWLSVEIDGRAFGDLANRAVRLSRLQLADVFVGSLLRSATWNRSFAGTVRVLLAVVVVTAGGSFFRAGDFDVVFLWSSK